MEGKNVHDEAAVFAGLFVVATCWLSVRLVRDHLAAWTRPNLQRHIVRCVIMVPVYCVASFLSLLFVEYAAYIDLCRDCYEALAIFSFVQLVVGYGGGDEALAVWLSGRRSHHAVLPGKPQPAREHMFPMNLVWGPYRMSGMFLYRVKQLTLQYVLVKPLMAAVALVLDEMELYDEGKFDLSRGWIYVTIVNNVSVTVAMYALLYLYMAVHDELHHVGITPKLMCIKGVLFVSFWQSIIVAVLAHFGVVHSTVAYTLADVSVGLQDFLIVIEMFYVAIAHEHAYPASEFRSKGHTQEGAPETESTRSWLSVADLIEDVSACFGPGVAAPPYAAIPASVKHE